MNVLIIGNGISAKSAYELALKTKDNPFLLIGKEEKIEEKYKYYLNEELPQIINKFDLLISSFINFGLITVVSRTSSLVNALFNTFALFRKNFDLQISSLIALL